MGHTVTVIPIRLVETDREGFDRPVVELWRDDDFVGMVFWDGDSTVVQIYPMGDGDVHDLEVGDLQRALDTAERIVDFETFSDESAESDESQAWQEEDPATLELVGEFDGQAIHRSDDGEGFFPKAVADQFIRRCEELGLAVVEMEGFAWDGAEPVAAAGLDLEVRPEALMDWAAFRMYANARAGDTLGSWPGDAVIAFVVKLESGDTFVA